MYVCIMMNVLMVNIHTVVFIKVLKLNCLLVLNYTLFIKNTC